MPRAGDREIAGCLFIRLGAAQGEIVSRSNVAELIGADRSFVRGSRSSPQRWALYGAFGVKRFSCPSKAAVMRRSVAALVTAVASGRLDVGEGNEVEINDGLERIGRRAVAQAVGQCCEPIGIISLQHQ